MLRKLLAGGIAALLATGAVAQTAERQTVVSFTQFDWAFRSDAERQTFAATGAARKAPLAGVKVGRDGELYITTPRWLDRNVPATLNKVVNVGGRNVLQPFPSWEANKLGDAAAFQNALGFAIDSRNRMYVVDMGGGVAGVERTPDGAQKLVIIDIATGRIERSIPIPDAIAHRDRSFLNDVAIDEANGFLYVSDSGVKSAPDNHTGIIVIRLADGAMKRVLANHVSTKNNPSVQLTVAGDAVFPGQPLQIGINGIAASRDAQWVYWSQTTGLDFHRIPALLLRDFGKSDAEIAAGVEKLGQFGGNSDGIAIDAAGKVYITDLTNSRIVTFDPATKQFATLAQGPDMVWPDTLAWGADGWLYVAVNQLYRAFGGTLDYTQGRANFTIQRIQTGATPAIVPAK
ncbi:L-dopachrome tautomerase-related protein [Bosea sp. (in: a-proteobacteria)]|uniref:L-dopachrome tautomerase-related protein n=1 Tax=Bosea sp. (in: a-proteobacteria) TaxID=1871050 RepID=UPI002B47E9AC|nr:L-dopachrome tautomerase-related protein [Bosea sp. (in: a-proteobacteria)]WRH60134.1 MAG: L-dopachrome tautomerase-related protein [Bosea sp. (in: a-proteobacteria)]